MFLSPCTETDIDSGVDENTQHGDTSPKTGSSGSRIPRKTPPESPIKQTRSRKTRPDGTPNFPRSKSVPKPFTGILSLAPSTADSVTAVKKGLKDALTRAVLICKSITNAAFFALE